MLSCHECERYIPVFLDHALEVKESLDVQAHLQSCLSCHDRAESERRLRTFVRQFLDVPPPPEEIKRAVILRAMQAERRCGWRAYLPVPVCLRDFAMGMATAALLGGNTVVFKPASDTPFSGLRLYELFHQAGLPVGAAGNGLVLTRPRPGIGAGPRPEEWAGAGGMTRPFERPRFPARWPC